MLFNYQLKLHSKNGLAPQACFSFYYITVRQLINSFSHPSLTPRDASTAPFQTAAPAARMAGGDIDLYVLNFQLPAWGISTSRCQFQYVSVLGSKSQPIRKGSTFQGARWSCNLWPRTNTLGQQLSQLSNLHVSTPELTAVEKGMFPKPEGAESS